MSFTGLEIRGSGFRVSISGLGFKTDLSALDLVAPREMLLSSLAQVLPVPGQLWNISYPKGPSSPYSWFGTSKGPKALWWGVLGPAGFANSGMANVI